MSGRRAKEIRVVGHVMNRRPSSSRAIIGRLTW
jgi:hypothetical protein